MATRSALDDFIEKQLFGASGATRRKEREVDTAEESILELLREFPRGIGQTLDPSADFDPQLARDPFQPQQTEFVPTAQSREFAQRRFGLGAAEDDLSRLLAPAPAPETIAVRGQLLEKATGKRVGERVPLDEKPAPKDKFTLTKGNQNVIVTDAEGKEVRRIKLDKPFKRAGGGGGAGTLTADQRIKRITDLESLRVKVESGANVLDDPIFAALFADNTSVLEALQKGDIERAIKQIDRELDFHERRLPEKERKKKENIDKQGILTPEEKEQVRKSRRSK